MSKDAYLEYDSFRYDCCVESPRAENLLIERPLAITINHEPWTLTMQTPGEELQLAAGLAFTEGVIKREIIHSEALQVDNPTHIAVVNILSPAHSIQRNEMRKRTLMSLSSCGICGRTELPIISGSVVESGEFDSLSIPLLIQKMQSSQTLFMKTGGCHAAAAFNSSGELLHCYEDIGRHNAVDKVIGDCCLMVSFLMQR